MGAAVVSSKRYQRTNETYNRFIGNVCIAVGGILPGIGGAFTRFGHTEVLYVTELLGLLFIYAGYRMNVAAKAGLSREEGNGRRETGSNGENRELITGHREPTRLSFRAERARSARAGEESQSSP